MTHRVLVVPAIGALFGALAVFAATRPAQSGAAAPDSTPPAQQAGSTDPDKDTASDAMAANPDNTDKVTKSEDEWREELTDEEFRILRQKGTEAPWTGKYLKTDTKGVYRCAGCGHPLFSSDTKFECPTGWPSFYEPLEQGSVEEHEDRSHGMRRTEITCARCGGHLGHVFPDGPQPTGLRYCINSVSLDLDPEEDDADTP
jgi:peptide-methionine (R)-S-oxide reductase